MGRIADGMGSIGEVPEWTKGADCKSVAIGFQGSNPCLPTTPSLLKLERTRFARRDKAFSENMGGRSSGVELQPSKLAVASSNLVARSIWGHYPLNARRDTINVSRLTNNGVSAHVAQLAEHVLGKDEVTRSIRVVGSTVMRRGR